MGGSRRFEITIVSAQNLPDIRRLGSMKVYAKVILNGNTRLTHIDRDGGTNPTWNSRFIFTIDDDSCLRRSGSNVVLVVHLFCDRFLGDKFIGQARIPVKELFDMGLTSRKTLGYPVSGTAYGTLNIRYWFEEKFVAPPMPTPASKPLEFPVSNINNHFIKHEVILLGAPLVENVLLGAPEVKTAPQGEINRAASKSMQAAKTPPPTETNAAPLKALEPRKILPAVETNGTALKSLKPYETLLPAHAAPLKALEPRRILPASKSPKASETLLPARETNMALEPRKILPAGDTNGAASKSLKPSETLPVKETTNVAPIKALEPRKILPAGDTKGAASKSLKPSETLPAKETNMAPIKASEPRKILPAGDTNGAALKSPNTTKTLPHVAPTEAQGETKPGTKLKSVEAPKIVPQGETSGGAASDGESKLGRLKSFKAPEIFPPKTASEGESKLARLKSFKAPELSPPTGGKKGLSFHFNGSFNLT